MANNPKIVLHTDDADMLAGAKQGKGTAYRVEGEPSEADVVITYRVEPKREKKRRDLHIPDLSTLQQFSSAFLTLMMQENLIA